MLVPCGALRRMQIDIMTKRDWSCLATFQAADLRDLCEADSQFSRTEETCLCCGTHQAKDLESSCEALTVKNKSPKLVAQVRLSSATLHSGVSLLWDSPGQRLGEFL